MLSLTLKRQEEYSRGVLILKSLLGWAYVGIPHGFMLMIYGIWFNIQTMLLPWVILITGNIPQSWFEFRMKYMNYALRVYAYLYYLSDTKPTFGLDNTDDNIKFELEQPESLSRVTNFLIFIKGIMIIPHVFLFYIYGIGAGVCTMIAWWVILITGKYPEGMFNFVANTFRFCARVGVYALSMTDEYPPFSGKE